MAKSFKKSATSGVTIFTALSLVAYQALLYACVPPLQDFVQSFSANQKFWLVVPFAVGYFVAFCLVASGVPRRLADLFRLREKFDLENVMIPVCRRFHFPSTKELSDLLATDWQHVMSAVYYQGAPSRKSKALWTLRYVMLVDTAVAALLFIPMVLYSPFVALGLLGLMPVCWMAMGMTDGPCREAASQKIDELFRDENYRRTAENYLQSLLKGVLPKPEMVRAPARIVFPPKPLTAKKKRAAPKTSKRTTKVKKRA